MTGRKRVCTVGEKVEEYLLKHSFGKEEGQVSLKLPNIM